MRDDGQDAGHFCPLTTPKIDKQTERRAAMLNDISRKATNNSAVSVASMPRDAKGVIRPVPTAAPNSIANQFA